MGELICSVVDVERYEDLQHHVYGYNDVWRINDFDEIDPHVPLDKATRKECCGHYMRQWQLSADKPEMT